MLDPASAKTSFSAAQKDAGAGILAKCCLGSSVRQGWFSCQVAEWKVDLHGHKEEQWDASTPSISRAQTCLRDISCCITPVPPPVLCQGDGETNTAPHCCVLSLQAGRELPACLPEGLGQQLISCSDRPCLLQGPAGSTSPAPEALAEQEPGGTKEQGHWRLLTSATVRMKYIDGCCGSIPSSFIPTLKPFLCWEAIWYWK